jgi:Flp pilus assembly pilin Flp
VSFLKILLDDEEGQDLVEYALLLGFSALASAALMSTFGNNISGVFKSVNTQVASANTQAS